MDDTLQRLLEAEKKAEKLAQQADQERESLIQSAILEARAEEHRFEARIPEIQASFVEKAEARAGQTVAELKRRFEERHAEVRQFAEQREEEALDAAFRLLTDPEL